MYLSYYHLKLKPFQISTDPRFLWLGEKHREAFATLKYGVLDGKGFLLLTGDVGTGKSTLVNALLKTLGSGTIAATVRDPSLDPLDFFNFIAQGFGIDREFTSKGSFLLYFSRFLHEAYHSGKKVLLIIDEAQRIKQDLLEEIRMLSNIERDDTKLINIFFVGQDEFNNILLKPENRAIRQRITVNYHIPPLNVKETARYISHRLTVARATANPFLAETVPEIHAFSKGYPRLINIICDRALLTGFVEESKKINAAIIRECAAELRIPPKPSNAASPSTGSPSKNSGVSHTGARSDKISARPMITATAAVMFAVLLALGAYLLLQGKLSFTWSGAESAVSALEEPEHARPDPEDAKEDASLPAGQHEAVAASSAPSEDPVLAPAVPAESPQHQEEVPGEVNKVIFTSFLPSDKVVISFSRDSIMPDADSMKQLNILAERVLQTPDSSLVVRGYTDSLGNAQYNRRLARFRANIVKSYLVGRGFDEARITAIGRGAEDPVADNSTIEGRMSNRRVEIEVIL